MSLPYRQAANFQRIFISPDFKLPKALMERNHSWLGTEEGDSLA